MRKKIKDSRILFAIILSLFLVACGSNSSSEEGDVEGASAGEKSDASWEETSNLDATESVDELYEAAKKEGKVVVYSQSSRIKDVKASFEKQYPGIEVEAYDMGTNEIVEKVVREQEAGLFNVDVVFIKDSGGTVSNELVKEGKLHKYAPSDINDKMVGQFKDSPGLPFYFSTRAVFFNTEKYSESPVNNWWDLTEPEWKSKVVLDDPMLSADTLDFLGTIVQNSEDMSEAYEEKYGHEIVLNGTENAGYEFIKRLLANDPVFVKSSDDVVTAIGSPGQENPPIGISTSSKARNIKDKGLNIEFVYDISPKMSVPATSYLYVADQAENVNAAKLMIRWMAGEADGKAEGFSPYNVLGSWSTREDIVLEEQVPAEELNLWPYDPEFLYQNLDKVRDFILKNQ